MWSSSDIESLRARYARIDATFADEDLRVEAYAVIAREALEGCTTCVDCCNPPASGYPPIPPM